MTTQESLERLKAKSVRIGGIAVSIFTVVIIAVTVLVVLLVLSVSLGWSGLAALIFAIAGAAAGLLCFFFDAVKAAFGKGRTVSLGILVLYLHLMAILGFAAPDFFAELGLSRWMALTIVFFAITWSGSYALVSFDKASKIVSILIVLITLFSFIPGNSLVTGIQYLGQNVLRRLDQAFYDTAVKLDDSEGAIRQKYFDEYQRKVEKLERAWQKKEISASQYDQRRRAIDKEYRQFFDNTSSGKQELNSGGALTVVGALVTDNLSGGLTGNSDYFISGTRQLYYYMKYRGAADGGDSVSVRWFHDGAMIREKSALLQNEAGELLDSCRYDFSNGAYEVILAEGAEQKSRVAFKVEGRGVVRIDHAGLSPQTVRPGEVLKATVEYYLQGSSQDEAITVREQRLVRRNGSGVMDTLVRDVSRLPGRNSSTARVYLPSSAPPGEYDILTIISHGNTKVDTSAVFSVARRYRSPSPERSPSPVLYPDYPSSKKGDGKESMSLDQLETLLKKVYRK